jgi:CTD small phosphatase-like protein 2
MPPEQIKQLRFIPSPSGDPLPVLVLDLDETLVHCTTINVGTNDPSFGDVVSDDSTTRRIIRRRPFVTEFLEFAAAHFEVVVFTTAEFGYASKVVAMLDPKQRYVDHLLTRTHCAQIDGPPLTAPRFIKDLTYLDRPLDRVIIVDNNPTCFVLQPANGIGIVSWTGDPNDRELCRVMEYLQAVVDGTPIATVTQRFRSDAPLSTRRKQQQPVKKSSSSRFPQLSGKAVPQPV